MPTTDGTLGIGLAGNGYIGKNKYGQLAMFDQNNLQYAQPGSVQSATIDGTTYNSGATTPSSTGGVLDTVGSWFTPAAGSNTSTGGQILGGIGAGAGAVSGLAGAYYAGKNYQAQKEQQEYLKSRDALADAKASKFAANVGGGATV